MDCGKKIGIEEQSRGVAPQPPTNSYPSLFRTTEKCSYLDGNVIDFLQVGECKSGVQVGYLALGNANYPLLL